MRPLVLAVVLAFSSLASANCVQVGTLTYVGHGTFQCQSRERLFVKHRFARLRYSTAAVAAAKSSTSQLIIQRSAASIWHCRRRVFLAWR